MERSVPPAGSTRKPWLWQIWLALLIAFALALTAHFMLRPDFALSPPILSFRDDTVTVTSEATNRTDWPITAVLRIIVGLGSPGTDARPPRYVELARRELAVSLGPCETRVISTKFPASPRRPNTARIEIGAVNNHSE